MMFLLRKEVDCECSTFMEYEGVYDLYTGMKTLILYSLNPSYGFCELLDVKLNSSEMAELFDASTYRLAYVIDIKDNLIETLQVNKGFDMIVDIISKLASDEDIKNAVLKHNSNIEGLRIREAKQRENETYEQRKKREDDEKWKDAVYINCGSNLKN